MFNLKKSLFLASLFFIIDFTICFAFDLTEDKPIIVNGDRVEFFSELNKVVAEGNVSIEYGTATLTCDKITVFTNIKEAFAEGNVKLKDEKGIIEGKNIFYNFDRKLGKIVEANIKSAPYFCVSPDAEKFPTKFILRNADITTCNLDKPHYHFHCREVEIVPGDKLRAKGVKIIVGSLPIMYVPFLVQDIKDKREGLSFSPGMSKEWGTYLLSNYSYYLNDDLKSRFHFDWRANKGFGGGMDLELNSDNFGDGVFHYYQVKEHLRGRGEVEPIFKSNERYKTEYRHKWDIDDSNHFTMEVGDYSDVNFLKNYFYRQYEKESQPRSYMLFDHSFSGATLSIMLQKRLNQFYTETEKIPEVKLETISQKIMDTPFYYQNLTSVVGFTSRTAYTDQDEDVVRLDTYNKISHPFNFAFLDLNPYVGTRYSFYSKDKNGDEWLYRNVFYSGLDMLTKFYRIFNNIKINSYGLEIDNLRHIITPSVKFEYAHHPTLPSDRLTAFDEIDSIVKQNRATLSLENKLQTKRNGTSVDFLTFIVESPYDFKLEEHGGRFQDIEFDLELLPNSWLTYESDASFDLRRRSFRDANFDLSFLISDKGKVGAGYRYLATGEDDEELTLNFEYQLNPKWKIRGYHRFDIAANSYLEQEYTLSRDLHCWEMEFSVNTKQKKGVTFWVVLRLKAFPDVGFEFEKSHHRPKTRTY